MQKINLILFISSLFLVLSNACSNLINEPSQTEQYSSSVCNNSSDLYEKDECFINFATELQNPSICENIEDVHTKYDCFAESDKEGTMEQNTVVHVCEGIKNKRVKDDCFFVVAFEEDEPSICERITDTAIKDDCFISLSFYSVFNSSICERIQKQNVRDSCLRAVSPKSLYPLGEDYPSLELLDPTICEDIKNEAVRGYCYTDSATSWLDTSICQKIQKKDETDYCMDRVNEEFYWPQYCRGKYGISSKCFSPVAKIQQVNISVCERFENQQHKYNCIIGIAARQKNLSICQSFKNRLIEDVCYVYTSALNQDSAICEKISNETLRNYCLKSAIEGSISPNFLYSILYEK